MIKTYQAEIFADKWPYKVTVEGSGWGTAASRAMKQWKKTSVGRGSRAKSITIRLVRSEV